MPTKEFFEQQPLYTWMLFPRAYPRLSGLPRPTLRLGCPQCGREQNYAMANDYRDAIRTHNASTQGAILHAVFRCEGCARDEHQFFLRFSDDFRSAMKVGQFPQRAIASDPLLESALKSSSELYRKGLASEAAGQGIGAFRYYRRLAEEILPRLLDDIRHQVDDFRLEGFDQASTLLRASRTPLEDIEPLKDLLPASLRPKRIDLLGLLCRELRADDDRLPDKTCLERAVRARHILVFILKQVEKSRRDVEAIAANLGQYLSETDRTSDGSCPSEESIADERMIA